MSLLKRFLLVVVLIIAAGLLYLLMWPVPITPAAWTPPDAPILAGQFQQNSRLTTTQRLSLGTGFGPEDVALDAQGRIYGGFEDGRIIQLQADGTQPRVFADTHGRPLGLSFDQTGNLIVADAIKGLLSVNPSGEVTALSTGADGIPFACTNDLDVAADPGVGPRLDHGGADPRRDAGAAEVELGIDGGVSAAFARVMVEVHEVAARHDLQAGAAHAQRRVHLR